MRKSGNYGHKKDKNEKSEKDIKIDNYLNSDRQAIKNKLNTNNNNNNISRAKHLYKSDQDQVETSRTTGRLKYISQLHKEKQDLLSEYNGYKKKSYKLDDSRFIKKNEPQNNIRAFAHDEKN